MKRLITTLYILLLFASLVMSCSRKKSTFVSRNYHAVTAEFNTLYNGENAFNEEINRITSDFSDNFWDILPIERLAITDEIKLGETSDNSNFRRAEEKAAKAIQKHSIAPEGVETNPQIDEAYLLLGKSRYFDQRFIPALEAFNYILYKYPASDKINSAKIWREKTNMRLDNDDIAIKNLKRLLEQEELKTQELANATAVLGQAYLNQKHLDSAITQLKIASNNTKNNTEKGRYTFILGQLYNITNKKDSANYAFDNVIKLNRKIPRIFLIAAYLEKVKNFDIKTGNKIEFLEHLEALEESRENRPFLDKIYHHIAEYHLKANSDSVAETYYKKSLRTNSQDSILLGKNYQAIGNIAFDKSEFKVAGAYFDSTLTTLKENTKQYRNVKKKRENLDDVIFYEDITKRNDSILTLVNLPKQEQIAYFTNYINALKQKDEAENGKTSALTNTFSTDAFATNTSNASAGGLFYFYNPETVAFGKNDFSNRWGDRTLKDNWRLTNNGSLSLVENSSNATLETDSTSENEVYNPEFYISKLPTNPSVIDSISKDRNFAYYQLGLIYKEKLKEYNLAKNRLEFLLSNNPENRLILPSKYNLYKIYTLLNLNDNAKTIKNDIIQQHPDSRYASILLNPNKALNANENSPENSYKKLYKKFLNQEYGTVISESEALIKRFDGEAIVPKFEFLKATSKAKLYGFEPYQEAIKLIALNYPNSDEGKRAQEMLKSVLPLMQNSKFASDDKANAFKAIFEFKNTSTQEIDNFIKKATKAIARIDHFKLTISKDFYNYNTTFVTIHGFNSIQGAKGFSEFVKDSNKDAEELIIISETYFGISSKNYEILQIHKNLDDYLKLYSN